MTWLLWILLCIFAIIQLPFRWRVAGYLIGQRDNPSAVAIDQLADGFYLVAMVAFATMGLWVLRQGDRQRDHPARRMGWLMLIIGSVVALETFCSVYAIWGLLVQTDQQPPLVLTAGWIQHWIWTTRIALLFIFLPLLFPDGQLPSPWWRPIFWATVALHISGLIPYALAPISLENSLVGLVDIPNPVAVPAATTWGDWLRPLPIVAVLPTLILLWRSAQRPANPWWRTAAVVFYLVAIILLAYQPGLLQIAALCLAALASQIWRYRGASPVVRQQIRSLVLVLGLAGTLWAGSNVAWWLLRADGELIRDVLATAYRVTLLAAPVALGLAILRYRLWDIDLIINRTVVYGALTTLVLVIYTLIVTGVGRLFHSENNFAASLLATGVIAVLFQPARMQIQSAANRWLFGERDDPSGVLTRLTSQLEVADSSSSLLSSLVETIAASLRLPYVALWLQEDEGRFTVAAQTGREPEQVETLPLIHQQEPIGQLVVAPRSPGEAFSTADQQLLAAIARLAATTARTIQLTDEVQEARIRTVSAREEERRRLRRDLHDGLGPVLAGQGLKLAAARQLLRKKPAVAEHLLDEVMNQSENTVAEVRRLVYALRPPTLDEFGLVEAIREHVAASGAGAHLQITVDAPQSTPEIPAAIEVAAFRIVQEALNNVIRHAQAQHCTITVEIDGALQIAVQDDGVGLMAETRSGVGLHSMRERATEVGGTCTIEAGEQGGVIIRLSLPLEK